MYKYFLDAYIFSLNLRQTLYKFKLENLRKVLQHEVVSLYKKQLYNLEVAIFVFVTQFIPKFV